MALLLLAGGGLLASRDLRASDAPDPAATGPSASPQASAAAPAPVDTHAAILRGSRRTLIHIVEADRDLALDLHDAEVTAGDGTGAKSLFLLVPYGVDYMIRTLRDASAQDETCLGVKIVPDGAASLTPTACEPTLATVFSLAAAGGKDDKGRPTYLLSNAEYGFVQYSLADRKVFVEEVGDAPPLSAFSLVDRGPAGSGDNAAVDVNDVNKRVIEQFRAGGPIEGMHRERLLLLTTTRARSGGEYTTPMMFHRDGDRLLVIASNAGAPRDPDWFRNLLAHPEVTVEIGDETYPARATPLAGADRERAWAEITAAYPFFLDHEANGRRIPVVALTRR